MVAILDFRYEVGEHWEDHSEWSEEIVMLDRFVGISNL